MMKQQRLILLILFGYIIQIHWVLTEHLSKRQSTNNCPSLTNEEAAVKLLQLKIPINPIIRDSKSYASMDTNQSIIRLEIVDKKKIPSHIFGLRQLKRLEIRNSCFDNCNYRYIPSKIQCLASSLTELDIYDTKITYLPKEIGELIHLQTLKLSNAGLRSLPDTIGKLKSLTMLYLPDNNLESLPSTIKNLRSLRQLTLTNNPNLHSIEPINNLPSLTWLNSESCSIKVLPQNLPKLTLLGMSNNSLTKLMGISTLGSKTDNRKSFYFDWNYIESVEPEIGSIKNLDRLKLDQNKLTYLPKEIFNIRTYSYLNIEYNEFDPLYEEEFIKFELKNPRIKFLYKNQKKNQS